MPAQTNLTFTSKPDDSHLTSLVSPMPAWLRRPIGKASELSEVQRIIKQRQIHTICEEGRCPNRGECYAQKTATFLLMGPTCTRACAFCQVDKGHAPMPLDPQEPQKVAESVQLLGLRYVVLTSVARDDLSDGGAGWFAMTMEAIREVNPLTEIEVLTPDFWGGGGGAGERGRWEDEEDGNLPSAPLPLCPPSPDLSSSQWRRIALVVAAKPACYNHNVETVRRLQGPVRRGAKYDRSLDVLRIVKEINADLPTKSGLMLGHGETEAEVVVALEDLRGVGCDRLTLGQYMRPSLEHLPVQKYWTPEEFDHLGAIAREMGFSHVRSGPLVRSSYHAGESD
ncbi:lipoyl synthase [Kamptonema sp. UHCC 0994]|uniref:lipoyl synthase n=1 Tax=Kamptonema sp. UHCC 0994 TaxID=3031329 RepID=UPI0023BA7F48|nr:lipoyl synthase [Kamptonema sp. UHCC 0994]MDF0556221.1 lipoyl synthase [Kamptonema sp. UHCC 0994]